ncbi:MAG: Ig-like domain-containing protein, partial [Rhodospirillaceae bacterium]
QTLSDSVSYTVVDENGASSTATLTITITGTNDAPVVTSPTSVTVAEGHAIDSPVYTIEATDPNNDRLTYSLSGPDADAFAVDAATGEVKFIAPPNFEAKSEYSINVIASDGTEQHVQAVTVRIADVAPVGNDRTVVATEDGAYVFTAADFTFAVGDPNAASGVEAVRIETLPSGGVLKLDGVAVANGAVVTASDIAAGKLTFEPAADANGPGYARFSVSLRDSEGTYTAARNTITVDVSAVNDAPVATGSVALPAGSEDGVSESVTVASLFRTAFNDARDEVAGGSTSGALAGVAIVDYRADPAKGAWQYSPDGTTWITINSVTDPAAAVTLKSTDALRFVPAANFNGPVPAVTVKLIDTSTTVTTGAVVDVRTSGGATAYSADNVLLTHSVAAVAGTPTVVTTDVSGDQDAEIGLPITVTAGDPGEVVSVTLSGIPNGMKFVTSTGEAFTPSTGALTLTAAQVVGLRVTPPEGYTGTLALTVQATETDGTRQASSPSQRVFISVTPRPLPIVPTPVVSSPVIATPVVTAPVISTPAVTAPAVTPEVAAPRPVTAAVASTTIPSSTAVTGAAPAAAATGIPASALPSDGSRNTSPLPTGQINLMQGVNTAAASTVSSPVTSALPASSGAQLDSTDRGFNVIRTAAAAPAAAAPAATPAANTAAAVPAGGVVAPASTAAAAPTAAPAGGAPGAGAPAAAPLQAPAAAAAAGAQAAGPALDTAPQRGGDTLFVYQGIPSTAANAGQNLDFTVPREAFGHTNQKAIVQLDAMRTNGQPLPEWIDFDPVSGKFTGKPPRGAEGVIEIKVVARDNEGREATTTFSIRVGDVAPAQSPRPAQQTGAAAAAERIVVGEAGDADEVADKAAEKQAKDGKDRPREQGRDKIRIAALPFSEQLNRAKQDGLLARIMDTKDKAKTKLSPPVREA